MLHQRKYRDDKNMKRGSISYVIRELQIKTIVRYCYIPIRMAKNPEHYKMSKLYLSGGRFGFNSDNFIKN